MRSRVRQEAITLPPLGATLLASDRWKPSEIPPQVSATKKGMIGRNVMFMFNEIKKPPPLLADGGPTTLCPPEITERYLRTLLEESVTVLYRKKSF